jgi:hypothetical protein
MIKCPVRKVVDRIYFLCYNRIYVEAGSSVFSAITVEVLLYDTRLYLKQKDVPNPIIRITVSWSVTEMPDIAQRLGLKSVQTLRLSSYIGAI